MAERRHGGRRGDARGGGRGGGRGDLPNEEAARQCDLRDIENDDLRQKVRNLQRDIENGDLRQQVRDLQRRLARLEERRGKSNPMRSNALERRSMDDPLFSDVFTSSDADESSMNSNSNIFSMPVYDEPVYDEDIFSMPVYDEPVYDEDIFPMRVYDTPVYDEDIFYELPEVMSKSMPPSVKFDNPAEDEHVVVDDDEELEWIVVMPQRKGGETLNLNQSTTGEFAEGSKLASFTLIMRILIKLKKKWANCLLPEILKTIVVHTQMLVCKCCMRKIT